ncbi:MAG: phosphate propanoyltransferase [Bacteroidota bacterium]
MTRDLRQQVEQAVRAVADRLIPINVSARHLHINQEHLEILFGPGSRLTKLRDLVQPGEFASNEIVAVVGPNRRVFEKVRILGPTRSTTQVELSYNDGRYIGLELPARVSGDVKGTAPITLVGPHGALHLEEGAIRALRHIHMSPEDAARLGVQKGQKVTVKTVGPMSVSLNNTVIRTGENLKVEMHIDTDEANAAGLESRTLGLLI